MTAGQHCGTCTCNPEQRQDEARWNDAIDWLLNSRYCGEPEIQSRFWALVDGKTTRDDVESYDYRQEEGAGVIPLPKSEREAPQ